MRFPCMIDHDRMSLYGEVMYSFPPQPENRGQVLAQEDPMDLDLHPPMPQGQFPRSQTSQQPQDDFGSTGPSVQNPIGPPTKPSQHQQQFDPSTVLRSPISSTTVGFLTNNSLSRLSHMTTDSQRQSTSTEGRARGLKRKGSTFGEPSQPSKVPRYLEK